MANSVLRELLPTPPGPYWGVVLQHPEQPRLVRRLAVCGERFFYQREAAFEPGPLRLADHEYDSHKAALAGALDLWAELEDGGFWPTTGAVPLEHRISERIDIDIERAHTQASVELLSSLDEEGDGEQLWLCLIADDLGLQHQISCCIGIDNFVDFGYMAPEESELLLVRATPAVAGLLAAVCPLAVAVVESDFPALVELTTFLPGLQAGSSPAPRRESFLHALAVAELLLA